MPARRVSVQLPQLPQPRPPDAVARRSARHGQTGEMAPASYRTVLATPGVRRILATSLLGRLPAAMVGLAIILRVAHGTGSYSAAGATTAVYVVGAAALGPVVGRLADRVGRRPVLVATAVLDAVALVALSRVPVHDTAVLLAAAVVAGGATPPVAAAVRSLWPVLVDADARHAAYAVDSTLQELTFVLGPSVVAGVGSAFGTAAPLVVSALCGLGGTLAFAASPAVVERVSRARHVRQRLASPRLTILLASAGLLVLAFGMIDVAVVAFAGEHHHANQAGLLLGTWSLGSLVGGATFGARAGIGGARSLPPLLAATGASFALLASAPGLSLLYPLLAVAGLAIAPSFGCIYALAGSLAPENSAVEVFSWLSSAVLAGAAIGAAVGGVVVQHLGSGDDELGAAAAALVAAGITLGLRRRPQAVRV